MRNSIPVTFLFFLSLQIVSLSVFGQKERVKKLKADLEELSTTVPALNDSVNISVNGATIQEFLRAIATADAVNISIDPNLRYSIVNNFSNVRFLDVLVFLIDEYDLDINIIGNIISIYKYVAPPEAPEPPKPHLLKISYRDSLLTLDLKNDSLISVAKKITQLTGTNVIVTADMQNERISGYIQNSKVGTAIEKIALANNVAFEKTKDGFFVLSKPESLVNSSSGSKNKRGHRSGSTRGGADGVDYKLEIEVVDKNTISIYAENAPLDSIVKQVSDQLGVDYHIISELKEDVSLLFSRISYDKLLDFVFDGKDFSYRKVEGIYIIGEKKMGEIQETEIIQLQYRTVDAISEFFPKNLQDGLEIIEFTELNSLLVTGPREKIGEFAKFIHEIDRLVPVVLIEVMILESKKTSGISTGLSAGFGDGGDASSVFLSNDGSSSGGFNFSFDAKDINGLLNSLNGFTNFNIGRVTESFYLNISALETDGMVKVRSTPKLSTLNGHEAQLSSGETTYYVDETISTTASQSINERYSRQYKSVNADLTISIKPIVSGDNQITLDIDVSQSDFTGTVDENAPPGTINRSFKSIIRVKDQEMVLLGGLDKNYTNDAGSGIPFLSKIPVLKWLFSSRKKEKQFTKLNIFIKPTVIN